jgi:hypothetical protein
VHGIAEPPGATEIAPGTGVYQGRDSQGGRGRRIGGLYKPLEFRFFVGRHFVEARTKMHKDFTTTFVTVY